MSEIKITTEKVREAYKKGNDCVKGVLQNLFGEEVCAPKNVMDRVKTFEDACIETGTDIQAFNEITKNLDEHVVTYMKLSIIVKALNEDDKFPYFTKEEWRYYPYFWLYTKDEYEKMNAKDREKVSRVLFRSYWQCVFVWRCCVCVCVVRCFVYGLRCGCSACFPNKRTCIVCRKTIY